MKSIEERHGKLHVLVNNSGTNFNGPIEDHSAEMFEKVMKLNVTSLYALTRLALPLLKAGATEEDPARVINIARCGSCVVCTVSDSGWM